MDHYQTLGVAKTATPDEIKKAYRKLASQHHPDKGGDTAMFQKVEEAYRVLSDPQKRQEYDNPTKPFPFQDFGQPGGFSFNVNGMDFGDIFGQMFGQQVHRPQQQRTPVFRTGVNISLKDAYTGTTHQLKLQTQAGQQFISIDIPKGIKNGDQIKYDNVIDKAVLIVEFRVTPDLRFERRGNDLYCTHSIDVLDLIVGTTFVFTTINGKMLEVNIKPKTQPHMQLKIKGEGMPIYGTATYGDQIILLNPYIPDNIDDTITQSILQSKQK